MTTLKKTATLEKPVTIKGNGTSLWCEPKQSHCDFVIEEMFIETCVETNDKPYELRLFGKNTQWFQYTDEKIESQVKKNFLKIVQEAFPKYKVINITWSEQGMQPENGWSFDVVLDG